MNYNRLIDHTVLKPETQEEVVIKLCKEALEFNFASVCVNPTFVELCAGLLKGSEVKVCTVIGFPLGANTKEVKGFEALDAVNKGAEEIDMVINIGALKDKKYDYVYEEIKYIKECCKGRLLKVIIETCLLTDEEKVKACELSVKAGADYVKTSTGFSTGGATVSDIALMRKTVGPDLGVKASGGVRTYEDMVNMVEAGATRIGTSSGPKLMK
jgi:deoxyribose-phosphate aldolase